MPPPPLAQPLATPAEYLAAERRSREKNEYVNGRIYAMAGASRVHNLIVGNLFAELRSQLRGRPCEAYVNDMRVKVQRTGMYTYPDVAAVCGDPGMEDEHLDTLLNPSVIVEVLSPSTESYDRGEKFAHYRRLESLQEYVLVAQVTPRVEHFRREGDHWVLTELDGTDAEVALSSVGCVLALGDIYDRVVFPPGGPSPQL
jgi:Uma2 family endonuclease